MDLRHQLTIAAFLCGLATDASAEPTNSFTNVPVAIICPNPTMTAYLESNDSPPHFSKEWESIGGHAHCRTVKNDRPLLITKISALAFHGREYVMAELFPAGVIMSIDGFGGPYYLLRSRLSNVPTAEQITATVAAFMPTNAQYNAKLDDPASTTPTQPTKPSPTGRPQEPTSDSAAAL